MSGYAVKSIQLTVQGEGARTGRRAVFLRFTGCNLWTGREKDRERAICQFCDTDFLGTDGPGGGVFGRAEELAHAVAECWHEGLPDPIGEQPYVVCTGGEPLLQLDEELIDALRREGFEIAVETNGTRHAPDGIDWLCVSPKAGAEMVQTSGQELKIVFPQEGLDPAMFAEMEFDHFYLQAMDGPRQEENLRDVLAYCRAHPRWRVSIQMHKVLGVA